MNFELKVKDIVKSTYILTGKIFNEQLIKNLINDVKNNKDEGLSYKTSVKGHFTGFKSLVQNNNFLNFLKEIKGNIKVVFNDKNFIVAEAWGNICKSSEEVIEHHHGGTTGFCGILYLTEGGPGTYFRQYDLLINEEVGKYVLFDPCLLHSVKKIENDIERITIAFNMEVLKPWGDYTQAMWVNKKNEI
jgi:hypothetical protein